MWWEPWLQCWETTWTTSKASELQQMSWSSSAKCANCSRKCVQTCCQGSSKLSTAALWFRRIRLFAELCGFCLSIPHLLRKCEILSRRSSNSSHRCRFGRILRSRKRLKRRNQVRQAWRRRKSRSYLRTEPMRRRLQMSLSPKPEALSRNWPQRAVFGRRFWSVVIIFLVLQYVLRCASSRFVLDLSKELQLSLSTKSRQKPCLRLRV
mmetsp:Transcript_16351/g.35507  ORF Transcript_16351/g.35507 Transcript_16351/m.35507 type:complete len:208 (+) Transcript_16351:1263-1886(+)